MVDRSQYGRDTDFQQDNVDFIGDNCYIPTSGNCFIKCINHLTGEDFVEDFLSFIRIEQRRSKDMTTPRIQAFCRKTQHQHRLF